MKVFILNVGVNASHGSLRSPIFDDNTFEFIPIPERSILSHSAPDCPALPRYCDITSHSGRDILNLIPEKYHNWRAHNDPEFDRFTYGDYPTVSPRVANLKKIEIGDYLFFLARLVKWENGKFTSKAGFYLIGFFEIEDILKEVVTNPTNSELVNFSSNVHIKRGLWNPAFWNGFWVFKGSKKSMRFKQAIPFSKEFVEAVLTDSRRGKLLWSPGRTELQIIGSYTRACRIIDGEKIGIFWKLIKKNWARRPKWKID